MIENKIKDQIDDLVDDLIDITDDTEVSNLELETGMNFLYEDGSLIILE